MKRLVSILAGALLALPALAQYYTIEADTQRPGEQQVIDRAFVGNTPYIRLVLTEARQAVSFSNVYAAPIFKYGYDQYDTNGMVSFAGVWATSNSAVWTNVVAWGEANRYYFSIIATNAAGQVRTLSRGQLVDEYDPATATTTALTLYKIVNWNEIQNLGTVPWITSLAAVTNATLTPGSAWAKTLTGQILGFTYPTNISVFTNDSGYGTGNLAKAVADILYDANGAAVAVSNATWGTFWTIAQQSTFSNWTAATYLPLHGTADNSAALGGLTVAGVSNAIIAAGDVRYDVAGAAVNASNGVLAHVFAGVGTTGTVTAAAGTATDYLARNGSWTALPSSAGFVVTNLDTTSANVTFTLPAPGTSFYVLSKTNSANWLYVVYGTTTSSVAGTASVKAYPDVILSLWRVEY